MGLHLQNHQDRENDTQRLVIFIKMNDIALPKSIDQIMNYNCQVKTF